MKRNSFFVEHVASFTIEVYPMIEINNKNVLNRISFIKISQWRARIEVVFLNTRPCLHSQNIKLSPVSLRPRSSGMHSYVLSNGQKHFVSHMFAMLQRWFFGSLFTFKLYRCKQSFLLYNAKNSQSRFIFWTLFLFNLFLYNWALMLYEGIWIRSGQNRILSKIVDFGNRLFSFRGDIF